MTIETPPAEQRRRFAPSQLLLIFALLVACAPALLAQEPAAKPAPAQQSGTYMSVFWLVFIAVCFSAWLFFVAWISEDSRGIGLPHLRWTSIMLGAGAFGGLLMVLIHAALGFLMLAAIGLTLFLYVKKRDEVVPEQFKLLSRNFLSAVLSRAPLPKGSEGAGATGEGKEVKRLEISLVNESGKSLSEFIGDNPETADAAGIIGDLIARASLSRSQTIRVEPGASGHVARFELDGVTHEVETLEPEQGQAVISCAAKFAGFESKGRASRKLTATLPGEEQVELEVRGVRGERGVAIVIVLPEWNKELYRGGLPVVGMNEDMAEKLLEATRTQGTVILISSPADGGKTTTFYALLSQVDIYTTNVTVLERKIQHELTQVQRREVPLDSPQFVDAFRSLLREEPNVIALDEISGRYTGGPLLQFGADGGRVIATIQASSSGQAVQRLLMGADAALAGKALTYVVNQRLIRKLCEHCKERIEPSPTLLSKLGIAPGQEGEWFKAVGCEHCLNVGYHGRTALLELLTVNDAVRQVIASGAASAESVRKATGKDDIHTLYQDGLEKVMKGVTTLEEVRRVLK